jgi:hypothetical protein
LITTTSQTTVRKQLIYSYLIPTLTQLTPEQINPPQKVGRVKKAAPTTGDVKDEKRDVKTGAPATASAKTDSKLDVKSAPKATPTALPTPTVASTLTMNSLGGGAALPTPTPATTTTTTTPVAPTTPFAGAAGAGAVDTKAAAALRDNKVAVNAAVQAVMSTLHLWVDRHSQLWIERAILLCTQHNPLFLAGFANAYAAYVAKHIVRTESQYSYLPVLMTLFRWSNLLLRGASRSAGGLAALAKGLPVLCKLQVQLLQKFHDSSAPRESAGFAFVALLFKHADILVPLYLFIISSAVTPLQYSVALEHLLRFLALPKQAVRLKANKAQLLKWFDEDIIGAKADLPAADVKLWSPFVKTLTHEEFADPLMISIKRMFLRMPDRLLAVLRYVVPALTIDLGRYYKDFVSSRFV